MAWRDCAERLSRLARPISNNATRIEGAGRALAQWPNVGLGVAGCQRLEHKRTPLGNRNFGHLDQLKAAPPVPLLRDAVDPLSVFERVVALGVGRVDLLPRGQEKDLRKVPVCRKPCAELTLVQRRDAIKPAQCIEDAAIKEDVAGGRSVLDKVRDVHAQRFTHKLMRNRSRTQPAPNAILDDGARAITDDSEAALLQRQQKRGLPCARATGDDYSRQAKVPSPVFATPNGQASAAARAAPDTVT